MLQNSPSSAASGLLQKHLGQLRLITPQQQQLTVGALCRGVVARDPAWVAVLATVVSSAPRAIQQQLAAQPGLLKDLAGYLAHNNNTSSNTAAVPAASPCVGGSDSMRSSIRGASPPAERSAEHQQHHQPGSSTFAADATRSSSSSSSKQLEAAAGALVHLLDCCGASVPPPYLDLAPALHAALQQRLVCLQPLAQALLHHHGTHMTTDQQLMRLVLEAVEQGHAPAAAVLAALSLKLLRVLDYSHPICRQALARATALLASGTAAGGAFLAAVMLQGGTLLEEEGMVEAACSGLQAACSHAAAAMDASTSSSSEANSEDAPCLVDLPPAHAVLLQYLRGMVGLLLHLAPDPDAPPNTWLVEVEGPLVPALAEAFSLLLESLQLPGSSSWCENRDAKRPYHDAAWAALLALCECRGATFLVALLFQHQPELCVALARSWDLRFWTIHCEEPANNAARLAAILVLNGSIPGQEPRRQQPAVVKAALLLWNRVWPDFWCGKADLLMEMLRLFHGPGAVMQVPGLLVAIFEGGLLGPEHKEEGWGLLLAAPPLAGQLVDDLLQYGTTSLSIVEAVLSEDVPELTQALLAVPGLGGALACCVYTGHVCPAVDHLLGVALGDQMLQAYLAQEPQLLEALLLRLQVNQGDHAECFWHSLADDDSGDDWLLQQLVVLDGVVAGLAVVDSIADTERVVERLLGVAPSLVCQSLLRQPEALEELLRTLVRCCWQAPAGRARSYGAQLLLLEGLAESELAHCALLLLPYMLTQGDAELSAGVFEAMHLIQKRITQSCSCWAGALAATSSRGAAVLCAEEQLAALRQAMEKVQQATVAAAAATQQLHEQHKAVVEAVVQPAAGHHLPGRSQGSNRQVNSRGGQGEQQQGAEPQQVGGSGQRKSKRIAAAAQSALVGTCTKQGAGGRLVSGKALPAPAAAPTPGGSGVPVGGALPAPKRTRH
jgi:hypothetical protein